MKNKKRILAIMCIIFILAAALTGCGNNDVPSSGAVNGDDYVRIGYGSATCHAPIHIAIENGYFADEGLNFEPIKVETAVISEAVSGNQIDAGFGLVGKFVQPLENGLPLKLTSGIHTGCTKIVTRQDSGINSIADLKGKRIGVAGLADSPALTAKRVLAAEGIGVTAANLEVEFVVYNNSDLPVALDNGAIDAFAGHDPGVSAAVVKYNLRTLLDTAIDEKYKDEYCCLSFVSDNLAKRYPNLAAKYTRAVMKASVWIEDHPKETAQIQLDKGYVTGDVDFNASLLESYNFKPSVNGGYEALKNVVLELQEIGVLRSETDANALIENSFIFLEDVE